MTVVPKVRLANGFLCDTGKHKLAPLFQPMSDTVSAATSHYSSDPAWARNISRGSHNNSLVDRKIEHESAGSSLITRQRADNIVKLDVAATGVFLGHASCYLGGVRSSPPMVSLCCTSYIVAALWMASTIKAITSSSSIVLSNISFEQPSASRRTMYLILQTSRVLYRPA